MNSSELPLGDSVQVSHSNAIYSFPQLERYIAEAIEQGSNESTSDLLSKELLVVGTMLEYIIPRIIPIPDSPIQGNRVILEWWNKRINKTISLELIERRSRIYWWIECGNTSNTDRKEGELISFIPEILLPFICEVPKIETITPRNKPRANELPRA
jgi:hypothetical protein